MLKVDILANIFDLENIEDKIVDCPRISTDQLLIILSKSEYNLSVELGLTSRIVSRYLSTLFPDRPKLNTKVDNWLLAKYLYKECKYCSQVKEIEEFHKDNSRTDGHNAYCSSCQNTLTAIGSATRQSKYKAARDLRLPKWVNSIELNKINKFYANCPSGYHVDHIVPLRGKLVSGLHCLNNLQYLHASENISKNNKYIVE